jgi:S1-C subfamily serine protease
MAVMDRHIVPHFIRRTGAAIVLAGALLAVAPFAHAGVPLPVMAETAGVPSVAAVVKRIAPAVVGIETEGRVLAQAAATRRQAHKTANSPATAAEHETRMSGSGVVFDARRGLIITTSRVIDGAEAITVKLADGRALPALRVGSDPETDVAVIRISAEGLTELAFGDSDSLEVGDFVFAVGNPAAFGQIVTAGIVSGLHRGNVGLEAYEDLIQTDAAVHSGGALVNLRGDLVGINTASARAARTNPGFGFAIPVNMARALADQMVAFGDIRRGRIGFTFDDAGPVLVSDLKLSAPPPGVVVVKVDARSAAERAGLRPGDVVTQLDGTPVRDATDLSIRIAMLRVGEVAEFAVSRRGGMVTLRAAPAQREPAVRTR